MSIIESGPPPTDPLGKADAYQVHALVDEIAEHGASIERMQVIAWRRPAASGQVVMELLARLDAANASLRELARVQRERDRLQRKVVEQQQVLDVQARRLRAAA